MKKIKKERKKIINGPTITIVLITLAVMVLSAFLSIIGFDGEKTSIVNGGLETSVTLINNIFSVKGLKFIFGNVITNLLMFEPLALLIVSIIAVSILESSGLLNALLNPLRKLKLPTIIFLTVIFSLIFTFFGEYAYIILIPLIGAIYKDLNHNPILGIITVFISVTLGYGAGIVYNYNSYALGKLTELAASIDVDPNYSFNLLSTGFIQIFATISLSFGLTFIINKYLLPKVPKSVNTEQKEFNYSKKGLLEALGVGMVLLLLVIYELIPNLPFSGMLLSDGRGEYIYRLFSTTAPFKEGLPFILLIIASITSYIYGKKSNNIVGSCDYSYKLGSYFDKLGHLFVYMFLMAQLISILNWTNIGEVFATNLITFLSTIEFSGILLIITLMIMVVLISIIIPDTLAKWTLISPLIIPLFMRSNITPDFTQFVFTVADGIGKGLTPLFIYFIIMLAFIQKYQNESCNITVFGVLKMTSKIVLLASMLWLIIIIVWYIIGLPIGLNVYPIL